MKGKRESVRERDEERERWRDREMERQSERLMPAWELGVRGGIIF